MCLACSVSSSLIFPDIEKSCPGNEFVNVFNLFFPLGSRSGKSQDMLDPKEFHYPIVSSAITLA